MQIALPIASAVEDAQNNDAVRLHDKGDCHTSLKTNDAKARADIVAVAAVGRIVEAFAKRTNPTGRPLAGR